MDHTSEQDQTRTAYDQLAPVWSATTDDGPFNGHLERPALQSLIPRPLVGQSVLDAGCGSGAQCEWLLDEGARVTGFDLSSAMITETRNRCGDRGRFEVADLAEPLTLTPGSLDGITCSLTLHYMEDWTRPLRSFANALQPGGWLVFSTDHPASARLDTQQLGYFDTELVSDTWRKGSVEVTQHFWRRPLGSVIEACSAAGFRLDRIAESRPDAAALARFPDELGPLADQPSFIVYRFRLQH